MLVSYYQQRMSMALQCAQAIAILQWATTFGWGFSSLAHIKASAPPWLADLWWTTTFFVLGLLCYHWSSFRNHGSYLHTIFTLFLLIVCFCIFFLDCDYMCSHLPCTFDGWVPVLDFYMQGFPFFVKGKSYLELTRKASHTYWVRPLSI